AHPPATEIARRGNGGGRVLALTLADFRALGRFDPREVLALRRHLSPNAGVFDELRTVDGFDGGVLLGHRWDVAMRGLPGGAGPRLHRDLDHPERLVVDVPPAAGGRRVVVSEAWYPGWTVTGARHLGRHRNFLMAFDAPAHGGRVVLTYHAPGLLPGAGLTSL